VGVRPLLSASEAYEVNELVATQVRTLPCRRCPCRPGCAASPHWSGDISYRWSDAGQQCRVSFAITRLFNGTNHRKEFSGYASNFVVSGSKEVLIHYVSGM